MTQTLVFKWHLLLLAVNYIQLYEWLKTETTLYGSLKFNLC